MPHRFTAIEFLYDFFRSVLVCNYLISPYRQLIILHFMVYSFVQVDPKGNEVIFESMVNGNLRDHLRNV